MKKGFLLILMMLTLSGVSVANDFHTRIFDFFSPIVVDRDNLTNTSQFGTIVYDSTDAGFYGLSPNSNGTWVKLGGVANGPRSEVFVTGGNGHGSSGTHVRRFVNTVTSIGSDITFTPSTTNGDKFIINADGVYAISYTDGHSSGVTAVGITKNVSSTTTAIDSVANSERIGKTATIASFGSSVTAVVNLNAGDEIRAQTDSTPNLTVDAAVYFRVTKVSD